MHVADRLQASMDTAGSIACVGLDPRVELLPPSIRAWASELPGSPREQVGAAYTRFNHGIIDAIAGACAAVKPQAACYEAFGPPGWQSLEDTRSYARSKGIEVTLDAKRGDIGSTATHYRQGLLDGAHGLFVLVKTSNPGTPDVQDIPVRAGVGESVVTRVADLVHGWSHERLSTRGLSDVGAVVGATWPDDAKAIRSVMPNAMFLVPGYGAQGGDGTAAVAGARPDGSGILVSSSRSIIGAWQAHPHSEAVFAEHARSALDEMNRDLNSSL